MPNSSPSPQEAAQELLRRRGARSSTEAFTAYVTPGWRAAKVHRAIAAQLERVRRREIDRLLLLTCPQHGKQLAHSTPMLTPDGWTVHGALRPGDVVFGGDGRPTRVVAISDEAPGDIEIEFLDGEVIRCHERHEWKVYDRRNSRQAPKVIEAGTMLGAEWFGPRGRRRRRARFSVDWVTVQGRQRNLPVEPYTLGAWLGGGSTGKPCITHAAEDAAVVEAVAEHYPLSASWTHKTTGVVTSSFAGKCGRGLAGSLTLGLRAAGVLLDKHIPADYLTASLEQRGQLLAGLMDTDGYIHHRSWRACFSTSNRRLAMDVATLVTTLGMRGCVAEFAPHCSSSGIRGRKPVFQVTFSPSVAIPCRLPRKRTTGFAVLRRKRGIRHVRRVAPVLGRCIQVEAEDGLYLAGRGLVPTHNSELTSRKFPALLLGDDPTVDVIAASATAELAEGFGRDVRNTINSDLYHNLFPDTVLAEDSQARGRWNTRQGGSYYAVGVGGQLFGRGGMAIIDDPFGSWEDAQSATSRDKVWDWYTGTLYNRVRPGQPIVVIQHRMHEEDLAGRLIERQKAGGDRWEIIELPADVNDPPWPERYDRAALERIRDNTDPRQWSALYLQNPTPEEGTFFKREWVKWYDPRIERTLHRYTSADFAVTEGGGDWTEIGTHGVDPEGDLYVGLDWYSGQTTADVWIEQLVRQFKRHKPLAFFGESGVIRRAIEPVLIRRMRETQSFCRLEWITRTRDKASTARALQARMAMGKVYLPDNEHGRRLLTQLLAFPAGIHDDAVDCVALIALALDQAHPAVMAAPEVARRRDAYETDDEDEDQRTWRTA